MPPIRAAAPDQRKLNDVKTAHMDTDIRDPTQEPSRCTFELEASVEEDVANENVKPEVLHLILTMSTYLCNLEENGEAIAAGFQRIPNRRVLPDYFEIISEPVAFSTVRGKIQKKQYTSFSEFVKDVAQICHNAQVYNRPSAPIFAAAVRLRDVFRRELKKLLAQGRISAKDATLPDLGELPPAEPSSRGSDDGDNVGEVEEEEEEEEDDDDDDDDDEEKSDDEDQDQDEDEDEDESSDDDAGHQAKKGPQKRQLTSNYKNPSFERGDGSRLKGGRPPVLLTPLAARILFILKGLRKFKKDNGSPLTLPFENLPDKAIVPDYYDIVRSPIALDSIEKKAKRKDYQTLDQALADIDLMFENAKLYNEDDSEVYKSAARLQQHARALAELERVKPDEDFRDKEGKLPLCEIQHMGQIWKIGDWVHIRNPNDLAKPIVGQIFGVWQDHAGHNWINACWYYRPEQTVHRFEKHFFEREVLKTGQYRDHEIIDVVDRCFVMFITRFSKGRPRGFPREKEVYVCEARYNEQKFRFNKIKTWASCLPDEIRETDYEMDLFDNPSRLKKLPSPIKHLLRDDARETDNIPRPIWGSPNAPPIVGGVHRRPPEPNESPPPEPTPPPPSRIITDARSSIMPSMLEGPLDPTTRGYHHGSGSGRSPNHYSNSHATPNFRPASPASGVISVHPTPVPIPQLSNHVTPGSSHMPIRPMQYQGQPPPQPVTFTQNFAPVTISHQQTVNNALAVSYVGQAQLPPATRTAFAPAAGSTATQKTAYNPPRLLEAFALPGHTNDALPPDVRFLFQHDRCGRVLLFTSPPLDRPAKRLSPGSMGLGHSLKYLAGRHAWLAERDRKRKNRDDARAETEIRPKRMILAKVDCLESVDTVEKQAVHAISEWFRRLDGETLEWQRDAGLEVV
ncbi:hypothetical protein CDD83_4103 [Cordyceps sp. RAO-2017]|nr:hypothetical protein CDD83_4103 [Cordyceps sp. RAO-2017]